MITHETYMHRCIELAKQGAGKVAPNPMVGAVLVYEDRIIGEGFHEKYGAAHAEVNCINSVAKEDEALIEKATIYVSLEPCAHFGKTPPCANLIIDKKIPKVVVGCRDPFKEVDGKGIEKLKAANIEITVGVLENECMLLNKRFFTFHKQHRPFILLKWAQTANGKIAATASERLLITNDFTNKIVHKWRSEEAAILVGTTTALLDNPSLTNRYWHGDNPLRMVIDMDLSLPTSLQVFDGSVKTIVFNTIKQGNENNIYYHQVTSHVSLVQQVLNACYQLNILSVLVEGGAKLLQSFIDEDAWDEANVITNEKLYVEGLSAPMITNAMLAKTEHIQTDRIDYFTRLSTTI